MSSSPFTCASCGTALTANQAVITAPGRDGDPVLVLCKPCQRVVNKRSGS